MGSPGVLDIEPCLELLETLGMGIVDILGIGDKLGRRRSIGGRHFNVEDWLIVQGAIVRVLPLPNRSR